MKFGNKHNLPQLLEFRIKVASTQWERLDEKEQELLGGRSNILYLDWA